MKDRFIDLIFIDVIISMFILNETNLKISKQLKIAN